MRPPGGVKWLWGRCGTHPSKAALFIRRRQGMKTTYYCTNVEFYDSGEVKACMTTNSKRGKSHFKILPGMVAFKLWWSSKSCASRLLEKIKDGDVDKDYILTVFSDLKDYEDKGVFKKEAA
jgi:hypothetical protein